MSDWLKDLYDTQVVIALKQALPVLLARLDNQTLVELNELFKRTDVTKQQKDGCA